MIMFKKLLNIRVVSLMLSMVFLCNTAPPDSQAEGDQGDELLAAELLGAINEYTDVIRKELDYLETVEAATIEAERLEESSSRTYIAAEALEERAIELGVDVIRDIFDLLYIPAVYGAFFSIQDAIEGKGDLSKSVGVLHRRVERVREQLARLERVLSPEALIHVGRGEIPLRQIVTEKASCPPAVAKSP